MVSSYCCCCRCCCGRIFAGCGRILAGCCRISADCTGYFLFYCSSGRFDGPFEVEGQLEITGARKEVESAKEYILKYISDANNNISKQIGLKDSNSEIKDKFFEVMMIPRYQVGLIIGKRGETLKMINIL